MASNFREIFFYKSFCVFWCVRFLGISAYQILTVAVAWQLYDITASALDLGLFGLFQFLPALLFALPAGQAVDRYNRVHIICFCSINRFSIFCSHSDLAFSHADNFKVVMHITANKFAHNAPSVEVIKVN